MNKKQLFGAVTLVAAASVTGVIAMNQGGLDAPPEIPANPAVELPVELVHVQPFVLNEEATHFWRAEQPSYSSGLLVVLEADPDFLQPRQGYEPVLFVGSQTVDRINTGSPSGQLVGIVPGMGLEELADAPIYFGQPELPERVDATRASAELAAALGGGLVGPGEERVDLAASDAIEALDYSDLMYQASFLIELYSPSEEDLIQGFRVERLDFK
jgi:hypothetical protein